MVSIVGHFGSVVKRGMVGVPAAAADEDVVTYPVHSHAFHASRHTSRHAVEHHARVREHAPGLGVHAHIWHHRLHDARNGCAAASMTCNRMQFLSQHE